MARIESVIQVKKQARMFSNQNVAENMRGIPNMVEFKQTSKGAFGRLERCPTAIRYWGSSGSLLYEIIEHDRIKRWHERTMDPSFTVVM